MTLSLNMGEKKIFFNVYIFLFFEKNMHFKYHGEGKKIYLQCVPIGDVSRSLVHHLYKSHLKTLLQANNRLIMLLLLDKDI